ncbi:GNAT family N-acetyltransferase [Streptomyces omiyaensis]|uniref:GNAT family N-acetyltransferase n=1 Tax=Streptomyces omiyaensis TaxID=68247 RepID=UPI003700C9FE
MIVSATLGAPATPTAPALVLRPWSPADATALLEAYRDPGIRRSTDFAVEDEGDALDWLRTQERNRATGVRFGFAVLESGGASGAGGPAEAPRLVGNAVLKRRTPGGPTAEVGYWTAAPARGRGVASRALEAVTDWAFAAFGPGGLERIELLHQVDNEASCRTALKCGYAFEGILPSSPPDFPLDGHLHVRPHPSSGASVTPRP